MKILQFCYKPPFPAVDGGCIDMYSTQIGLNNTGAKVKVLTFYSDKNPFDMNAFTASYIETFNPEGVYVDLHLNMMDALLYVLIGKSYVIERFVTNAMKEKLAKVLDSDTYDVVQIESIMLAPYIPIIRQHSKAIISFHCPNVEHLIWQRIYKNERRNIFKRWYLKNTFLNMKYYEKNNINNFDVILPLTNVDNEYLKKFGMHKPSYVVPIGFDCIEEQMENTPEANTLFHIGSMNWQPNEQGIKWFLNEVWDEVLRLSPDVHLYLAGRSCPAWLTNGRWQNVKVVGEVSDSAEFMCNKEVMIVPLKSGSGIRIKILEAMSLGKTVVATSIAAEGILYEDGVNILIANTKEEFAQAIKKLMHDKDYCRSVGRNAEKLIREKYSTSAIAKEIIDVYNRQLSKTN